MMEFSFHRSARISQIFVEYVEDYELQDFDKPVNKLQIVNLANFSYYK